MLEIAYLSKSAIPSRAANSVHVMKMCQAFAKAGCKVNLYCTYSNDKFEDVYSYYGVDSCFNIEKAKLTKVKCGSWIYGYKVRKKITQSKLPDLIYARNLHSLLFTFNLSKPFIYEAHVPPHNKIQKMLINKLFLSENFKYLVTISEALKQEYIRLFSVLNKYQIMVLHDGADLPKLLSNSKEGVNKEKLSSFNIGYVGHLYQGRGIELVLQLAEHFPEIGFHLVGGEDKDIEFWKNKVDRGNVIFYGHVPNGNLDSYYNLFDVVIAPYQDKVSVSGGKGDTTNWMSPLKIFEYMAYGKPMIVSNMPVLREVLSDKENCLLCSPTDIKEWIKAVDILKTDLTMRNMLSQKALSDFKDNFTWEKRAKRILEKFNGSL